MPTVRPNTIASRCMAVLAEGPATTGEIAAEVGLRSRLAAAHMQLLYQSGRVRRAPFDGSTAGLGDRKVWIWSACNG